MLPTLTPYFPLRVRRVIFYAILHASRFIAPTSYPQPLTIYFLIRTSYFLLHAHYSLLPTSYVLLHIAHIRLIFHACYFTHPTSYFLLPTSYFICHISYFQPPRSYTLPPTPQFILRPLSSYATLLTSYVLLHIHIPISYAERVFLIPTHTHDPILIHTPTTYAPTLTHTTYTDAYAYAYAYSGFIIIIPSIRVLIFRLLLQLLPAFFFRIHILIPNRIRIPNAYAYSELISQFLRPLLRLLLRLRLRPLLFLPPRLPILHTQIHILITIQALTPTLSPASHFLLHTSYALRPTS